MTSRRPADVLAEARRAESLRKRQAVLDAVQSMLADGERVTFSAIARKAGVSTWLVYAQGVREHIEEAIRNQEHEPVAARSDGRQASTASLKSDLAMARAEIAALREERDRLHGAVRQQLGQQLGQVGNRQLIERITELTAQCRRLEQAESQARAETATARDRVTALETELAGARTSLRTVLRDINRPEPTNSPPQTPAAAKSRPERPARPSVVPLRPGTPRQEQDQP